MSKSEKIPMEVLLPVALELFKSVPTHELIKPTSKEKYDERLLELANSFTDFCKNIQEKLKDV